MPPNFDRIARPYRWLEYFSFGPYLNRCRFHYLDELKDSRYALILGDGDGRFTARLLRENSLIKVIAVDSSAAMLDLLRNRVKKLGPAAVRRLQTEQTDALDFSADVSSYDAVITHFFLDCLDEVEIAALVLRLRPSLVPGAVWIISEFRIPSQEPAASFARLVVGGLYLAFRIVTGLRARRLPRYGLILEAAGFELELHEFQPAGLLVSQRWRFNGQT
jgi:SAM-dependent methyltransferase